MTLFLYYFFLNHIIFLFIWFSCIHLDWKMELFLMRECIATIISIWHIVRVFSCMMIYWLLSPFAIKEYTFSKSETQGTLLMLGQLGIFAMKMMNFSFIPTFRHVCCLRLLFAFCHLRFSESKTLKLLLWMKGVRYDCFFANIGFDSHCIESSEL